MKSLKEDYGVKIEVNDQYMSRDEMEIYDKFKNYNFVQLLVSFPIVILGRLAMFAHCSDKSKSVWWIMRKGRKVLCVFFLLMLVLFY